MILLASIEDVIFDVSNALRTPVLIAALLAGAIMLLELGGLLVELLKRRRRRFGTLEQASEKAALSLFADKDPQKARAWMRQAAWSAAMADSLDFIVDRAAVPGSNPAVAKALADFDFSSLRRLERTRLLVRFGPALGLMGTLIPLSPALAGLADGDVEQLSDNLQVAFSVTVIGLLIGAVAFAMSLVRDRLYGQDHSDLEFAANALTSGRYGSPSKETAEAVLKSPAGGARPAAAPTASATPAQGAAASPAAGGQAQPAAAASTQAQPATPATARPQAAPGSAQPQPAAPAGQPAPASEAPAASGKKRRFPKLFVPAPRSQPPAQPPSEQPTQAQPATPEAKPAEPKPTEPKKPEEGAS